MWARIDGDRVAEITDIDPDGRFHPSLVWVECGAEVQPGWTYDGKEFAPPVVEVDPDTNAVPMEIEGWQGEVIMRAERVDPEDPESQSVWDRVQDLLAAMPDGIEKITAQVALQRGKIRRDSPTLTQLAPLVPLSEQRIDDMFRAGSQLLA